MKFFCRWFKKSPKLTLDDLVRGDDPISLASLKDLGAIRSTADIVPAARKIMNDPKHSFEGYIIMGPVAAGGNVDAQFIMGEYCELFLERNEQAAIWYRKAAEQGHAGAQKNYADMLMTGKGVACDRLQAFQWYTMAADQNIAEAQYSLGEFYRKGEDVAVNLDKAVKWYCLARENGLDQAEIRLMQIRGILPGRHHEHIEIAIAGRLKLSEELNVVEPGIKAVPGHNGISKDFRLAFPLIYIN
jgi:hypothetical protein